MGLKLQQVKCRQDGSTATVRMDLDTVEVLGESTEEEPQLIQVSIMAATADGATKRIQAEICPEEEQIYLDAAMLDLLGEASAPDGDAFAAACDSLAGEDPLYVYDIEDPSRNCAMTGGSWDRVSDPVPLGSGSGWTFSAGFWIGAVPAGRYEMTIGRSGGRYYLYAAANVLTDIAARIAAAEAPESISPAYDYAAVDAYLMERSPLPVYSDTVPGRVVPCGNIRWQLEGDRRPLAAGDGWSFVADFTIDGNAYGKRQATIQEAGGDYYLYLPDELLDDLTGVTGAREDAAPASLPDIAEVITELRRTHEQESVVWLGEASQPDQHIVVNWDNLDLNRVREVPGLGWQLSLEVRRPDWDADMWQKIEDVNLDVAGFPWRIQIPGNAPISPM